MSRQRNHCRSTAPPHAVRWESALPALLSVASDADARVVLVPESLLAVAGGLRERAPDLRALRWATTDDLIAESEHEWQRPEISTDTVAFLQYTTSGSTTTPRGVIVRHGSLMHNLSAVRRLFGHSADTRAVSWLPPYHDMGLIGGVLQPLFGGFPVLLTSPASFLQRPLGWLEAVSKFRATTSGGPNFAYDLCIRKIPAERTSDLDLSSWDVAFTGAEPISHLTIQAFGERFAPCGFRREAFYPCYGLAEATLIVTGGLKSSAPVVEPAPSWTIGERCTSEVDAGYSAPGLVVGCGSTLSDQTVTIVDPVSLRRCPSGTIGEIWIAGRSVADGYWNRPEETETTFRATLADTGEGPFLRTGDLGFVKSGELFVTGRLKDLIIVDGRNHYPQDVEFTVERCHPALEPHASAAFSVRTGGTARLIVVAEVRRSYRKQMVTVRDWRTLAAAVRSAVARDHDVRVGESVFVRSHSIPKNGASKIQRFLCRSGYLADTLGILWREEEAIPDGASRTRRLAGTGP